MLTSRLILNVPGYSRLPREAAKSVPAAVGVDVRERQSVNQQVETEPGEGRGYRTVSLCHDDGLDAIL